MITSVLCCLIASQTLIGTVKPRNVSEVRSSNWTVGCEVLDRDFTDFESYKTYLPPLGIKTIRLQAGWAKCEKEKGKYDFAWLDRIIDYARSEGLNILLETSYGNPIYEGAGGRDLGAGFPTSEEGLAAWDRWVDAMSRHFSGRVRDWAMWNEPDLGGKGIQPKTPEQIAAFNLRTAKIIRRNIPDARLGGLSLAYIKLDFVEACLKAMGPDVTMFDWFIYHGYEMRPEDAYPSVEGLQKLVARYAPKSKLRQGENGCPSERTHRFALAGHDWTEVSQAKWDMRRMLGDLVRNIESSVYTICDFYHKGREVNTKGLLRSDANKLVLGVKKAYYAVQRVATLFDSDCRQEADAVEASEKGFEAYLFRRADDTLMVVAWDSTAIPSDSLEKRPVALRLKGGRTIKDPVLVDLLDGNVYELDSLDAVPLYDSPCVVMERAAVPLKGRVTVKSEDDGRALVNPGMGYVFHYYDNNPRNYGTCVEPGDDLAWFPGSSVVYLRVPWAYVEPQEGRFNWAAFDSVAQRFLDRGCQVAFRISCSEYWLEYATPKWVEAAGAKGVRYTWDENRENAHLVDWRDPNGPLWDPVYTDKVFLAKLDNFLAAFAARYDGRKEVAFVDIGTIGTWGEGHTQYCSRLTQEETFEAMKAHIALHQKHFKKTLLALSDDVDGSWDMSGNWPITDWARARGVTLRDDSILCAKAPNQWKHAEMAERYWRTLPVIVEHGHLAHLERKTWDPKLYVQSIESYHGSFMSIHGDPKAMLEHHPDEVAAVNRRLGCRFLPYEVSWPESVKVTYNDPKWSAPRPDVFFPRHEEPAGEMEEFTVAWSWKNLGVAPVYRDLFPTLTVKDGKGRVLAVLTDESLNLRTLEPAAPGAAVAKSSAAKFTLGRWNMPHLKSGRYRVFVSAGERDGTPVFALPLSGDDGHRRYELGEIEFR